ncbi:capsid protein [Chifec virus UA15_35]|uniref:Capsid protein n=1 Tax=Chifec virus UA15_35 TaxID=2914461 RepID=A0AAX3A6M3_9CIRC|nr:capsid protein [Chifec virus UA15_35]UNY50597.1 capsid protein [Chifec virus UA15_35]
MLARRRRFVSKRRHVFRRRSAFRRKPMRTRRNSTRRQLARGSTYFTRLTYTVTVSQSAGNSAITIADPGLSLPNFSGFNALAAQWQQYRVWKMVATVTPLVNQSYPGNQAGMQAMAVYRQSTAPSGGYTFNSISTLPNAKQKIGLHPISVSYRPSVSTANVQAEGTGVTALTQLSTGYVMRPKLNTRQTSYPNHYGFVYALNPAPGSTATTANKSIQLTVYAYITFYGYNGLIV